MEINFFREFVVLSETCNFIEAAERLFLSQSTLSKHIKQMELELGVRLFHRTSRKVKLSDYGAAFLPYARSIVYTQSEYTTVFLNQLENTKKMVTIGSIPTMAQYEITDVLARFKKENPHFTVNVIQAGDELVEMLRTNQCELAFIHEEDNLDDDFVKISYTIDKLSAVLPAGHTLANHQSLSLREIKDEEFLLLPGNTKPHIYCINACKQNGFEPRIIYTDHRLENIIDLVGREIGVSLLMKTPAVYLSGPNISIVDIKPDILMKVYLCYRKNTELSLAAKHFLRYVTFEHA